MNFVQLLNRLLVATQLIVTNASYVELRFIEKIVGPVQSAYLGQVPRDKFPSLLSYLDYEFGMERLDNCLNEIGRIMNEWGGLSFGQYLTLEW